jgi:hypothetical protein
VIVCGSRSWEGILGTQRIGKVMLAVEMLAEALGSPLQVVHGNCPSGADAIVDRWARRRGYEPILYHALWGQAGKGAGLIRNTDMANGGGDLCIGFLRDNSRGTLDMTSKARAAGIPTFIVDWIEKDEEERRQVVLPPCEVCGFSDWPEGGMHAARSIHMRQHERAQDPVQSES